METRFSTQSRVIFMQNNLLQELKLITFKFVLIAQEITLTM
jgi:hypothetical protein